MVIYPEVTIFVIPFLRKKPYLLTTKKFLFFMAVKMRLQRHGSKKRPFYFIVVADARSPRDGKFIQKLGTYNPLTVPATIQIDRQKALDWLHKGAQPTDTVRRILSLKVYCYLKHLLAWCKLRLFDEAAAMEKFTTWSAEHDAQVAKRQGAHKKARMDSRNQPVEKSSSEGSCRGRSTRNRRSKNRRIITSVTLILLSNLNFLRLLFFYCGDSI